MGHSNIDQHHDINPANICQSEVKHCESNDMSNPSQEGPGGRLQIQEGKCPHLLWKRAANARVLQLAGVGTGPREVHLHWLGSDQVGVTS